MPPDAPITPDEPPTVSVVIPVKDDAVALRRCLRALALQTAEGFEIVVVDNGSTDDSAEVARGAGARVVPCAAPGIPAAASTGYDHARGDLILRLDADCLPGAHWVETVVRSFAADPRAAVFTGSARFVDGPRPLRRVLAAAYLGGYAVVGLASLGHLPLFGSNLAFRRDAWQGVSARVHRDDPEVHDDLDLAFHLGERHRIRFARHAAMGMSMRPFADPRAFVRRVHRGFRTVFIHWPVDFPPVRWQRLVLRRMRRRRGLGRGGAVRP